MKFAPGIEKNIQGWLRFPRDSSARAKIWSDKVGDKYEFSLHPAKFNMYMVWELMKYLTLPGETILDPMAGTGTTMICALEDRNVVLVEVEQKYHEIQQKALANLEKIKVSAAASILLLNGDCRKFLPLPGIDCIIFSPPYADMIKRKKVSGIAAEEDSSFTQLPEYSKSPWNIGKYNYFMYIQVMEKVYAQLYQTAPVMAVVVKDRMRNMERVPFVEDTIKLCLLAGWHLVEEIKIEATGTEFIQLKKKQGYEMVEDESILILRR